MEIKGRKLAEVGQDILGNAAPNVKARGKKGGAGEAGLEGSDTAQAASAQDAAAIDVSNTQVLRNMLDANAVLEERRQKVERIKKLVQSGQYPMPASEDVARSLAEELTFEILDAGPDIASNDS